MGHRALIAYRKENGKYNLHYSHWGAADMRLVDEITPEQPFGPTEDTPDEAVMATGFAAMIADAADADGVTVAKDIADPPDTPVRPDPEEIDATFDEAIKKLGEAWYETLYVVMPLVGDDGAVDDMEVVPYRVESDMNGAVLLVNPDKLYKRSLGYDEGWMQGLRTELQRLVDDGVLDEHVANERFLDGVLERYADKLSGAVLAKSPAIDREHIDNAPDAFIRMGGRSRVLGEMYPTRLDPPYPWELPDGFPAVKTANGERVNLS